MLPTVGSPARRAGVVFAVGVRDVHPNPRNPRSDLGDLDELAGSIREYGILQPLLAERRSGDRLVLITGHRRLAAARLLGLSEVPVIVVGTQGADSALLRAMAENLQRMDLSPIDEARACAAMVSAGMTHSEVARRLSRSASWVAGRLELLHLPTEVQADVNRSRINLGDAAKVGKAIRQRTSKSVTTNDRSPSHFTHSHPLASFARSECDAAGHPQRGRIAVACGRCWEGAIRKDALGYAVSGYVTPESVDHVAVDRAMMGYGIEQLTRDERIDAVYQMHQRGLSDAEVGLRLGCSGDAVLKLRRRYLGRGGAQSSGESEVVA